MDSSVEVTYKSSSGEQTQNGAAQDAKHRLDFEITSITKVKLEAGRFKLSKVFNKPNVDGTKPT